MIAAATFGCEAEPVDEPEAPVSGALAPSPGANELSPSDRQSANEFAAHADAVFIGEVYQLLTHYIKASIKSADS